jgi:hypothetical protein
MAIMKAYIITWDKVNIGDKVLSQGMIMTVTGEDKTRSDDRVRVITLSYQGNEMTVGAIRDWLTAVVEELW